MQAYKTKAPKFSGSNFQDVHEKAFDFYVRLKQKTKRRTYVRSKYFNNTKIFIDLFWHHLFEKQNWRDRVRRMKFFACAIELIQKSRIIPTTQKNPNKSNEILHRFYGVTKANEFFCVQIKEDKKKNQKFLISVFPVDKVI